MSFCSCSSKLPITNYDNCQFSLPPFFCIKKPTSNLLLSRKEKIQVYRSLKKLGLLATEKLDQQRHQPMSQVLNQEPTPMWLLCVFVS